MDKPIRERRLKARRISLRAEVGDIVSIDSSGEEYLIEIKTPADSINPYTFFGLRNVITGKKVDYEILATNGSVRKR